MNNSNEQPDEQETGYEACDDYPIADWQEAVASDQTRLGYLEWIAVSQQFDSNNPELFRMVGGKYGTWEDAMKFQQE